MSRYQIIENRIGFKTIKLKTVDSTNNYARSLIKSLKNKINDFYKLSGLVVIADEQTAGKGTGSNSWESEAGKNIILSIIVAPFFLKPIDQFIISKTISLGIFDYLKTKNIPVKIKWPNDIYINDKKIGGILIENTIFDQTITSSIIGIGLNINQEKFSEEIKNPTSLFIETQKKYIIKDELGLLIIKIQNRYEQLTTKRYKQINTDYLNSLYRKDEYAKYKANGEHFFAKIISIDEIGRIVIKTRANRKFTFGFKEVEFL